MNKIKRAILPFLFFAGILLVASTPDTGDVDAGPNKCGGCDKAESCQIEVPTHRQGRFFKEQLGLNDKQHVQLRDFRQAYHAQRDEVTKEVQAVQTEMFKQLDKTKPNRSKLNELADKEGELHSKLKQLSFDHYEKMRSVLKKDQQKKLAAIYKVMLRNEVSVSEHSSHGEHQEGKCEGHEGEGHATGKSCSGEHGNSSHSKAGGCGEHGTDSHSNVSSNATDVFEEFHQN